MYWEGPIGSCSVSLTVKWWNTIRPRGTSSCSLWLVAYYVVELYFFTIKIPCVVWPELSTEQSNVDNYLGFFSWRFILRKKS